MKQSKPVGVKGRVKRPRSANSAKQPSRITAVHNATATKKVKLSRVIVAEGEDGDCAKGPWSALPHPFVGFVNKGSHDEAEKRHKRFPTQVLFRWDEEVCLNNGQSD